MSKTLTQYLKRRVIELVKADMVYAKPEEILRQAQDLLFEQMSAEEKDKTQFIMDGLPGYKSTCYQHQQASEFLGQYFRRLYLYGPEHLFKSEEFREKAAEIRLASDEFMNAVDLIDRAIMSMNGFNEFYAKLPQFKKYLDKARAELKGQTAVATVVEIPNLEKFLKESGDEKTETDASGES